MPDLLNCEWIWHWRVSDAFEVSEADCGIVAIPRPGHAYSIARCPRYMKREEWEKLAQHICDLHNATLGSRD